MADGTVIPAIGIDLGTTYSCVGYWRNDRVEIIPNDQGNRTTPSYVAFTEEEVLVGDEALNQVSLNPANTVFDAKRLIGRRFSDESVQSDMKLWPFKVVPGTNDRPVISFSYKDKKMEFAPEQISSMVLRKLKDISEVYIGSEVKDAVVTVPAYFNQSQRQATMDAAAIAGINVLRIINEPTAAAIAYGFDNSLSFAEKKNVLVFDLGGGTLDVSILAIENGNFEVKATAGDGHLGGEDFDNTMVNYYLKEFNRMHSKKLKKKRNKDISKNPRAMGRLRSACERAKRTLSSASKATIVIDTLFGGIDFSETLLRSKFEELNLDLFIKCIETIESCLSDAKMNKDEIDHVVLVGGSSRIPKVQQLLVDFFDGKDLSRSIHQDEAVAFGAAIQAAFLSGHGNEKVRSLVLMDVTGLSLGINTRGEVMHVVIPRNTTIPTRKVERFVTSVDNQTVIAFRVFEGERSRSTENHLLGKMEMTGFRMAPKGEVKVDVCFDLQPGGVLTLSAKDITTGQEAALTVTTGQLPREEVETMIEEAKKLKEDDQKYLDKNLAKLAFQDHVFVLNDDTKQKRQKIKEAIQWLEAQDELARVNEYEEEMRELMNM